MSEGGSAHDELPRSRSWGASQVKYGVLSADNVNKTQISVFLFSVEPLHSRLLPDRAFSLPILSSHSRIYSFQSHLIESRHRFFESASISLVVSSNPSKEDHTSENGKRRPQPG